MNQRAGSLGEKVSELLQIMIIINMANQFIQDLSKRAYNSMNNRASTDMKINEQNISKSK